MGHSDRTPSCLLPHNFHTTIHPSSALHSRIATLAVHPPCIRDDADVRRSKQSSRWRGATAVQLGVGSDDAWPTSLHSPPGRSRRTGVDDHPPPSPSSLSSIPLVHLASLLTSPLHRFVHHSSHPHPYSHPPPPPPSHRHDACHACREAAPLPLPSSLHRALHLLQLPLALFLLPAAVPVLHPPPLPHRLLRLLRHLPPPRLRVLDPQSPHRPLPPLPGLVSPAQAAPPLQAMRPHLLRGVQQPPPAAQPEGGGRVRVCDRCYEEVQGEESRRTPVQPTPPQSAQR